MLSPGEITKKISEEYDRKREKARERESTIQFKKRRREKKEQQSNHQKTCEVREGKSYETAVDMNNNICSDDICEIPPPQTEQACKELIPGVEYAYLPFYLEIQDLACFKIRFFLLYNFFYYIKNVMYNIIQCLLYS